MGSVTFTHQSPVSDLTAFRSVNAGPTSQVVSASQCALFRVNILNGSTTDIYVRFYDASTATHASTPVVTHQVAASGSFYLAGADIAKRFKTACSVRCVTNFADSGTTAPATSPIIELETGA